MKEHKKQILAVLALALALGMAMPSAVFASEGTDDSGISTQAADAEGENSKGDGAGDKEEMLDLTESIVELNKRIQTRESFADYRKVADSGLIKNMQGLESFTVTAEAGMTEAASGADNGKSLWASLSDASTTAMKDMDFYAGLNYLKNQNGTEYTTYKIKIDELLSEANGEMSAIRTAMATVDSTVTLATDLTPSAMIKAVKDTKSGVKHYAEYEALYNALGFVREATPTSGEVTTTNIELKYSDVEQVLGYNKIAVAAVAIDGSVMTGLSTAWKNPTTSAPEAPETGIVGLIESGALDLGMVTLIASVAVASMAGLGLIAKLYLKHKF